MYIVYEFYQLWPGSDLPAAAGRRGEAVPAVGRLSGGAVAAAPAGAAVRTTRAAAARNSPRARALPRGGCARSPMRASCGERSAAAVARSAACRRRLLQLVERNSLRLRGARRDGGVQEGTKLRFGQRSLGDDLQAPPQPRPWSIYRVLETLMNDTPPTHRSTSTTPQ